MSEDIQAQTEETAENTETVNAPVETEAEQTAETAETAEVDYKAEFEKWKTHARTWEERAKENAEKAKQLDELKASQSENDKTANEEIDRLKSENAKTATELMRLNAAMSKAPEGISAGQIRKFANRLQGSTIEELETDAEELFADLAPVGNPQSRRPKESLRPGASPDAEPEKSPAELADAVTKRIRGY